MELGRFSENLKQLINPGPEQQGYDLWLDRLIRRKKQHGCASESI